MSRTSPRRGMDPELGRLLARPGAVPVLAIVLVVGFAAYFGRVVWRAERDADLVSSAAARFGPLGIGATSAEVRRRAGRPSAVRASPASLRRLVDRVGFYGEGTAEVWIYSPGDRSPDSGDDRLDELDAVLGFDASGRLLWIVESLGVSRIRTEAGLALETASGTSEQVDGRAGE